MQLNQDFSAMSIYGTTLRSGCSKQRNVVIGRVTMDVECDEIVVSERFESFAHAKRFMERVMNDCTKNKPTLERVTKAFAKYANKFVYTRIVLNDAITHAPYCAITIY